MLTLVALKGRSYIQLIVEFFDNKKPAPLASAGFLFDRVLFSVEADQFSELYKPMPKSTLHH